MSPVKATLAKPQPPWVARELGVKIGVTAAHGTPVEDALIIWVLFGEHPV